MSDITSVRLSRIVDPADEIARLRKGIQDYLDGNYGFDFGGSKIVKCPHGQYRHEICEGCTDEHFSALLTE
jgi:hypothetical protein